MSEAVVAKKGPYEIQVQAGKRYFWCACGRSVKQPFCDGAHKGTDSVPVPFTAEADGAVFLCGCKATQGKPFCDGSHERI